ncbi:MAG: hypothetical protein ABS917_11420 [Solibacillus sp.]|uniref:hypothetical protein n=1 Tax=Solibacillus sp. TaxID=1909654 RepID=UPI003315CAC5
MENEKFEFIVNGNILSFIKGNQKFEIKFNTNEDLSSFLLKLLLKNIEYTES